MPTTPEEFQADAILAGAFRRRTSRRMPSALSIRGTPEWTRWVNDFARRVGLPTAVLLDVALRRAARETGYPAPPCRYVDPDESPVPDPEGRD